MSANADHIALEESVPPALVGGHLRTTNKAPARVLLADDDDDLRHLIATFLRQRGFDVLALSSGAELTTYLLKYAIEPKGPGEKAADIIISDVCMPGCSGLQVLADMRGRSWAPPMILITGLTDTTTHEEASRLGAVALVPKPVDLEELAQLVTHWSGSAASDERRPV